MWFAQLGMLLAIPITIKFFLPIYSKLDIDTAYHYLELRFGSKGLRVLGAVMFIIYQIGRMSIIMYLPCMVLGSLTGISVNLLIIIMATDFTDGLAMKAVKAVFDYLPSAYENGANDPIAREKMANASCMAGMAFANAFLGLNHSMAHKLGAFHHLPHGIANAVILTDVMRYNAAEVPTRMGTFSQYQYPHALARYAELGRFAGCKGKTDEEVFENFIAKLEELKEKIGIKKTIKDYGVDEKYFLDTLDDMTEQAFNDQCTGANPRYPLMSEMKEIYLKCYYGK